MNKLIVILSAIVIVACQSQVKTPNNVITGDIDNFWEAYDLIRETQDSLTQLKLIDSLYIQKGSIGLQKMMEVRDYSAPEYISLINKYPKFFNSIRNNTMKSHTLAKELNQGVEKLAALYPDLRPAKVYFTIGCMRTNGTTRDSLVLIGSELAMADKTTDISEFEGRTKDWLENFINTDPIDGLVLLNVHEYVHTQQTPIPPQLRHMVLYEGVAEFTSVLAMGRPSDSPAIEFGKGNPAVREAFEKEMFYERVPDWLWSSSPNQFGIRDLGYYIGYAIAEKYYNEASDKQHAIKTLIALDYSDATAIDDFIDNTGYFSKPIDELMALDQKNRPKVTRLGEFENGDDLVDPNTKGITLYFSEKLNGYNTGVDYSDLGAAAFPQVTNRVWSNDSTSWKLEVSLEPSTQYKFWVTSNFRTESGVALLPYLIEFKTKD